jgi:pseudouridine synthase
MKERIQKVLANAGVASRRAVEQLVLEGRVSVNDEIVMELPILVDPQRDKIEVDGEPVRLKSRETGQRYYILMNKPRGVYSTNVAQGVQKRAIDLLPPDFPARVYPVGRLDAESRGLLLLTNDGELTNQLTHPRYGVPKTYHVVVDGFIQDNVMDELRKGVWLVDRETEKGFRAKLSHAKIISRNKAKSVLEITLKEGKNRQVRRMLAKVGHKVRDLIRVRMGPLTITGLKNGEWRPLTNRELKELRGSI